MYLNITAQTRTIRTTPLLALTTFTPAPVSHVGTAQTTSAQVSSPRKVLKCYRYKVQFLK